MTRAVCTDKAKLAAIYLEAAKITHDMPACACWAMAVKGAASKPFADIFEPAPSMINPDNPVWWGRPGRSVHHGARILALCFMAAMVEAGDA